jgi:diaminohydroxyphosphoribosylaminopyrimidine deaminase/5-amino-6-(5-phosphoribosylamino)uracil reductase
VICATEDPNPLVNGGGIARLRSAGIEVVVGVLKEEAEWLNRAFFKVVRTGMPWVTLKAAVSLDGKIATASGKSGWISGRQSRERVHQLRHQVDAVLVGANTARQEEWICEACCGDWRRAGFSTCLPRAGLACIARF